jgi:cytochrome c553
MRHLTIFKFIFLISFLTLVIEITAEGQSQTAVEAKSILVKHCSMCHGSNQSSGLDLRESQTLLKGGLRGPAVIPGKSSESLLFQVLTGVGKLKMPPNNQLLSPNEIETIRLWIDEESSWKEPSLAKKEKLWWAFRKPLRPKVPNVNNSSWIKNPIDAFVLARLTEKKLTPAPPANKQTLVRRAYFDLLGLPPTPEQVEQFLLDTSPHAFSRLIDKLLKSPHYGERWGRHWLDVVRYADTGGFETDMYFRNAWRYRDYVVKSFNDDKPYDRFLQEQIAGDELWPDNLDLENIYTLSQKKLEHLEAKIGTGLYTLGPEVHESNMDSEKLLNEKLTDAVDITGAAFMGLTMGCARCHDHKFDPLSQRDYYSLQAIFAESKEVLTPLSAGMAIADHKQFYPLVIAADEVRKSFRAFEKKAQERIIKLKKKEFPFDVVTAYEIPEEKQTPSQQALAKPLKILIDSILAKTPEGQEKFNKELSIEEKREKQKLLVALGKAILEIPEKDAQGKNFDGIMEVRTASVLGHIDPELIPKIYVLNRGDLGKQNQLVHPSLPKALAQDIELNEILPKSSHRRSRKRLALWLSRTDHPLTSRVMINRIWLWHFGRGIVGTPNDFGRKGERPSHEKLLNWLATEFVSSGWSIKAMHRMIMLSNTYQMSSQVFEPLYAKIDPENRYLWRMNRRRLEGEALWDSMHSVAGTLNLNMGGRAVTPPLSPDEFSALSGNGPYKWHVSSDLADHRRRGIYILVRRNFTYPMFEAFDNPDNSVSCPKREVTTVTPQVLWFMNHQQSLNQAQEFAKRLLKGNNTPSKWIEKGWYLALGRLPTKQEKNESLLLLQAFEKKEIKAENWLNLASANNSIPLSKAVALTKFCLSLFNLSEFMYVD